MKDNKMKNIILIATLGLLMTACSGHIKTPALSFGKKCAETNDGQMTYSYVWLYDKNVGLKANEQECDKIAKE